MKVALLGCGPAGMMAAHALARDNIDFDIYSDRREPSRIGGAMYLHQPIPGLNNADPDGYIMVSKLGSASGYASKVSRTGHETSWTKFGNGIVAVWNLRDTYDKLWLLYSSLIKELVVGPRVVTDLRQLYDIVVSTIPRTALCEHPQQHSFACQLAWIRTGGDLGVPVDSMIYDGRFPEAGGNAWYRASHIFGYQSKEYPEEVTGAKLIRKPLWNDCDCHPEVFTFGRYGKWEKRWLTNDAYTGARDLIRTLTAGELHPGHGQAQRQGHLPTT